MVRRGAGRRLREPGEVLGTFLLASLFFGLINPRLRLYVMMALAGLGALLALWWLVRRAGVDDRPAPGEGAVRLREVLRWLDRSQYRVLHGIRLAAGAYEDQWFDHLVVGPGGVFNLAVWEGRGKIVIDPSGVWLKRTHSGKMQRAQSPLLPLQRRRCLLEAILEPSVHVHDLIVLTSDDLTVEGQYHCPVPIVTLEMLLHQIQGQQSWKRFTPQEVAEIEARIKSCMYSRPS